MKKLNIKSKKDWAIAFVLAFLFLYLIVMRFEETINEFLLPLTPDKISFFNQPDHGVYAVTVFAMSVLTIGVMIYKKVKAKYMILALAGGILITGAVIGGYYYECHLILKIPSEYKPESVMVTYSDDRKSVRVSYPLDEETKEQIVDKVLALEPLSKGGEKLQSDQSDGDDGSGEISISIWYPRGKGYSYQIWVSVKDDVIRIHKSHSLKSDPIYQDNGLLELLESINGWR